jgi:hypothetical protein
MSAIYRFYFPGFPAFPGFPTFMKFPFPGENGRESREIKYVSFYLISTSHFPGFFNHVCFLNYFVMMITKIMPTLAIHISDLRSDLHRPFPQGRLKYGTCLRLAQVHHSTVHHLQGFPGTFTVHVVSIALLMHVMPTGCIS